MSNTITRENLWENCSLYGKNASTISDLPTESTNHKLGIIMTCVKLNYSWHWIQTWALQ